MARRINLVPRSERPRTKTDWGLLGMVGLFIIVIFGLALGYYMFSNVLDDRKQNLADLQVERVKLEQQVAALSEYEKLATQTQNVQAVVQSIYSGRTLLSDVLDAVSLVVPQNAWFQSLQLSASDPGSNSSNAGGTAAASSSTASSQNAGIITIQGQTYSFEDISTLMVRLQLIPSLTNVSLTSANQTQQAGSSQLNTENFTIGATVVNNEPGGTLPLTDVEVQGQ